MITMRVRVVTLVDQIVFPILAGRKASYEKTLRMPITRPKPLQRPFRQPGGPNTPPPSNDPYAAFNSDGPAEVEIGVTETLSGPQNTYSSINVSVRVSMRCDQTKEQIEAAKQLLFAEGLKALSHYIDPHYEQLLQHLQKQG